MKTLIKIFVLLCVIGSCTTQKTPSEFKVISYNIRLSGLDDIDGEHKWENRKQATINMLLQEAPSLFGLQEALLEQVEFVEQNLPQYTRIGVGRDDGENAGEFMAIFFLNDKFNLLKHGTFWLSETPETVSMGWDAACHRTVTWVHLQEIGTGKEFYFFNTHFDHLGEIARKESIILIINKIKEIAGEETNVIFGGDLNSETTDDIFNPLKIYLKDARECSPITDNKGTFNGFGTVEIPEIPIVIDHFFCRNVKCLSFRTLDGDYGVPYISDHYPIEFVFEVE